MPSICDCGQKLDLIAALDALPTDGMGRSGMFVHSCSGCGQKIEVRLRNGKLEVGYSYFGGSMHFEVMRETRVTGLKITRSDPDDLDVGIGTRRWHFGIRHISRLRFVVLPQAFAAGKRLGELNFEQWGVTVMSIERGTQRIEPEPGIIIAPEDFLHLAGPDPALTRAWHYMNDGKSKTPQSEAK